MLPQEIVTAWDDTIEELLSKIERKLPKVAEASQDLQDLRDLFKQQLADAAALRSKLPLTYLNRAIPTRAEAAPPIGLACSETLNPPGARAEGQHQLAG